MSTSWLADKIEQWLTAKLIPYARNARTHLEAQIALTINDNQIALNAGWDDAILQVELAALQDDALEITETPISRAGDVWQIKKPHRNDLHPTTKPVELVERAIRNSSRPGDTVLDCFGGSGSTLIAAEKSGRRARLMELDPKYVDTIVRRWQNHTGQQATRESDGVAFDALSISGEARVQVAAADVGDVGDVAERAIIVCDDNTAH